MSEYAIDIQHITKTYNMYKSRPIGLKRRLVQPKILPRFVLCVRRCHDAN